MKKTTKKSSNCTPYPLPPLLLKEGELLEKEGLGEVFLEWVFYFLRVALFGRRSLFYFPIPNPQFPIFLFK
jgi:hypothetical protein